MSELVHDVDGVRERLVALVNEERTALVHAWLASAVCGIAPSDHTPDIHRQAECFLTVLAESLRHPSQPESRNDAAHDDALRAYFPAVYRVPALLALAEILAARLDDAGGSMTMLAVLQQGLNAISLPPPPPDHLYNERLGRLSQLSWQLNALRDQNSILRLALTSASELVQAASSAIWLWDADQQLPVMTVTPHSTTAVPDPPLGLVRLLRQTCASACAFSVDAGESDEAWPAEMQTRAIAFIPLPAQEGCLGILTVHHQAERSFSHDDILLLASLGNLAATALRNVQLHANERHLVNLLQTSIRQVVEASASTGSRTDEFVQSLLHVAEGLTRAEAVCLILQREGEEQPFTVISGPLAGIARDQLLAATRHLYATRAAQPVTGVLAEAVSGAITHDVRAYYAMAGIALDGKNDGIIVAYHTAPFIDDQIAFLRTMADQIGVGVSNRQQAANLQRLLIELSNVNYVSEVITSTFDQQRIFATISQASSQALNAPIVLCGWLEDNGTLRILPHTTVGIPDEEIAHFSLTCNNQAIRMVVEQQKEVNSRALGRRGLSTFPALRKFGVRDWVCVPMIVKPRTRGIMLVADRRRREFSRREIALLSTYANQAALAMENSLLYEQIDHQFRQMEQLYQVTRAVGSTLDLDEILQGLLGATTAALQVPAALICLTDNDSPVQRVVKSVGIDPVNLPAIPIDPGEGIIGMVGQRGESVASTNLARDGRSPLLRDLARSEQLVASLTVPLQVHNRILGTLTVISREPREFTTAHEQLLLAMATEAAVAVQNAHRYAQERARTHALRNLVGEAVDRMTTTLETIDELVEITQRTEPTADGIQHMRYRLAGLAAVQACLAEDHTDTVDITDAVSRYIQSKPFADQLVARHLDVRLTGAHLTVPSRTATALIIFVIEWLITILQATDGHTEIPVTIAFQQLGKELLVHLEDAGQWQGKQASVNHAIMTIVTRTIPGTMTESFDGGLHRVRFRFNRPPSDTLSAGSE